MGNDYDLYNTILCQSPKYLGMDFYDVMAQSFETCLSEALIPENRSIFKDLQYSLQNLEESYRTPWKKVKPDETFLLEEAAKVSDSIQELSSNLVLPLDSDIFLLQNPDFEINCSFDIQLDLHEKVIDEGECLEEIDLDILRKNVLNDGLPLLEEPIILNYLEDRRPKVLSFSLLKTELKFVELEDQFEMDEELSFLSKESFLPFLMEEEEHNKNSFSDVTDCLLEELELPILCSKSFEIRSVTDVPCDDRTVPEKHPAIALTETSSEDDISLYNCDSVSSTVNAKTCSEYLSDFFEDANKISKFQNRGIAVTDETSHETNTVSQRIPELNATECLNDFSEMHIDDAYDICDSELNDNQGQSESLAIDSVSQFPKEHPDLSVSGSIDESKCADNVSNEFSNDASANDLISEQKDGCSNTEGTKVHVNFLENLSQLDVNKIIKSGSSTTALNSSSMNSIKKAVDVDKLTRSSRITSSEVSKRSLSQKLALKFKAEVDKVHSGGDWDFTRLDMDWDFLTVKNISVNVNADVSSQSSAKQNFHREMTLKRIFPDLPESQRFPRKISSISSDSSIDEKVNSELTIDSEEICVEISGGYLEAISFIESAAVPFITKLVTFNKFKFPMDSTLSGISSENTCFLLNQEVKNCQDACIDPTVGGVNDSFYCILLVFHGLLKALEVILHFDLGAAITDLQKFQNCHKALINGYYENLMKQLSLILQKLCVSNCIHPKIEALCLYLEKKNELYKKNSMKFKVLIIVKTYLDSFFSSLNASLHKFIDRIALYYLKEKMHLKTHSTDLSGNTCCIFVIDSLILADDFPWKEITLVFEYDLNASATWKKKCLQNNIAHASMKVLIPSLKKLTEIAQLNTALEDNSKEDEQLIQMQIIVSETITSYFKLLHFLETQKGITCIEKCYTNHLPYLHFADIAISEMSSIVLVNREDLNKDEYIDFFVNRIFNLHLKYDMCWVILNFDGTFSKQDSGTSQSFLQIFDAINNIRKEMDEFTIKLLYANNHEDLSFWIRVILSIATKGRKNHEKAAVKPEITEEELFFLSFPCLNPFVVQMFISSNKSKDLLSMSVEQLYKEFPIVPQRILKSFHSMGHSSVNIEHVIEDKRFNTEQGSVPGKESSIAVSPNATRPISNSPTTCKTSSMGADNDDFAFEFEKNMNRNSILKNDLYSATQEFSSQDSNESPFDGYDDQEKQSSGENHLPSTLWATCSPKMQNDFEGNSLLAEDLIDKEIALSTKHLQPSDFNESSNSRQTFSSPDISLEEIDRDYMSLQFGKTPYSRKFLEDTEFSDNTGMKCRTVCNGTSKLTKSICLKLKKSLDENEDSIFDSPSSTTGLQNEQGTLYYRMTERKEVQDDLSRYSSPNKFVFGSCNETELISHKNTALRLPDSSNFEKCYSNFNASNGVKFQETTSFCEPFNAVGLSPSISNTENNISEPKWARNNFFSSQSIFGMKDEHNPFNGKYSPCNKLGSPYSDQFSQKKSAFGSQHKMKNIAASHYFEDDKNDFLTKGLSENSCRENGMTVSQQLMLSSSHLVGLPRWNGNKVTYPETFKKSEEHFSYENDSPIRKSYKNLDLQQYKYKIHKIRQKEASVEHFTPLSSLSNKSGSYSTKMLCSQVVSKRSEHGSQVAPPSQFSGFQGKKRSSGIGIVYPSPKVPHYEDSLILTPSQSTRKHRLSYKKIPGGRGQTRLVFQRY